MAYEIEFDPDALKDLKKLDRQVQRRLVGFLKLRVGTLDNPREIGKPLVGAKHHSGAGQEYSDAFRDPGNS